MSQQTTVADVRHPYYTERYRDWLKWRDTYEGGQRFIDRYLKQFSSRESAGDYEKRKAVTYNPAFAKEAVDEIKNSIFQRLVDISRKGGSDSYNKAILGTSGGVDLLGSSMNGFIGRKILPELLVMSRVGVYVDMPPISGITVADAKGKRPYLYLYKAEDVCSWSYDEDTSTNEFANILLRDYYNTYDNETGLPIGTVSRYRRVWTKDGRVHVQFYSDDGAKIFKDGTKADEQQSEIILDVPRIPFVLLEISDSLLAEVANYQIALLNLASADIAYALNANFPFYTEQFEPRMESQFVRKAGPNQGGEASDAQAGKPEQVRVGTTVGRRYPKGMERPGFIHPSSEPMKISMDKQEQMKAEIRQLVNLSVTNLTPKNASAESKQADNAGLESGLSYIGLELENMERRVADFWSMYENKTAATVNYPEVYQIKTPADRQAEAERLSKLLVIVPSPTFQKSVSKRIAELTVSQSTTISDMSQINNEIEDAKGLTSDPLVIAQDVEIGICDLETASELRGYPKGTVKKAADDHAERLARIAQSQASKNDMVNGAAARGVSELDGNPTKTGSQEKKASLDTTQDPIVKDKQRGKGVNNGK